MCRSDVIDIVRSNQRLPVREDTPLLPDIYGAAQPSPEHCRLRFKNIEEIEVGCTQSKDERSRGVDGRLVIEQQQTEGYPAHSESNIIQGA